MPDREFPGHKVVVTGAGGGLGRAIVNVFAASGADVAGCDQSLEALAGLPLKSTHAFNLLDRDAVVRAATEIVEAGVPDVLINNAGWTRAETMRSLDTDKIAAEVDINLTSVMAFTQAILGGMVKRGSGAVVFVSSVNALAHFGNPAYAAAKAGVNAYARGIAVEYGKFGIRSNAVCPGSIRTPAWDHRLQRDPEIPGKLKRLYALERIVEPSEVVEAIKFLASSRASGITGVALAVDAGLTAGNRPFIDDILG